MDTWLIVVLCFLPVVIIGIVGGWLDWKHKCRKSIKESKLSAYLVGYGLLQTGDSEISVLSGILGVNSEDLVFAHRFKDDSFKVVKKISDVTGYRIQEPQANNYIEFIKSNFELSDKKTRYYIYNMAGISISFRVPKLITSRSLCKIDLSNDSALLFFYKGTQANNETVHRIMNSITADETARMSGSDTLLDGI